MLTFRERRKRVDSKQIISDMDKLENAFLLKSEKLNEKRSAQLKKRMAKMLPDLEEAFANGKTEEVERTLETLQIPSSKEWGKLCYNLVYGSAEAGVLRAHLELLRLRELYEFNAGDIVADIKEGTTTFEVNFPPEAEAYLKKYGYNIGVITEETVRQRIRDVTLDGLHNGTTGKALRDRIDAVTDTWVSQSHADTIARTETAKMYNAGRVARWLDPVQNGFVEALQYDSIVDTRTTELCKDLDGKIVSVENSSAIAELTPPNHFRCRATWIPVTRFEEWEDNFPAGSQAQTGFKFESPLPQLIAKAKDKAIKPLVTATVSTAVPAKTITDPLIIRTLNDEDFREAISNIKDLDMKYFLIKERAESMVVNKGILAEVAPNPMVSSIRKDMGVHFNAFGDTLTLPLITQRHPEFYKMLDDLELNPNDNDFFRSRLEAFLKEVEGDSKYLATSTKLKRLLKENQRGVDFKGFKKFDQDDWTREQYTFVMPKPTPAYKKAVHLQEAKDIGEKWLIDHMHANNVPKHKIQFIFSARLQRAYANGFTINFGTTAGNTSGVIVHEAGHVLHNNPDIGDLVNKFFRRRTNDLKMGAGRLHGEKVIADSFYNSYVGRIYGWEKDNRYGQEVLSMGLQAMHENPAKFYKEDKEHFLFTYAIMEGLH